MAALSNYRGFHFHGGGGIRRVEVAAAVILVIPIVLLILPTTNAADSSSFQGFMISGAPRQPSSGSPPTERDCQFALYARDALLQDDILAPLNIGVSVRSGVATLWGAVPSPALAHRAEERVRKVAGLAQVKNELRISVRDEDLADFLKRPVTDKTLPIQEPKRWDHSAPLVSRGEDPRSSSRRTSPPLLMPRIDIPPGQTKTVSAFEPAFDPKPAPPQPLIAVLENLRRSNERFQGIHFEVQQGEVHLFGKSASSEEVFNFAQLVAHLPGVQRVIVERGR